MPLFSRIKLDPDSEDSVRDELDFFTTPERPSSYRLEVPQTPDHATPRYTEEITSPSVDAVNRRAESQANALPVIVPQLDIDLVLQADADAVGNQTDDARSEVSSAGATVADESLIASYISGEASNIEPMSFESQLLAHRPELEHIHNLADLFLVPHMPAPPSVYAKSRLKGTKGSNKRERNLPRSQTLQRIVYVPNLVEQLRDPVVDLLKTVPVDLSDPAHVEFIQRVHPAYTSRDLPPIVYSEHDSEDWVMAVLCRPILATLQALAGGQIPSTSLVRNPFLASAPGGADRVIADGRFVSGGQYPKEKVRGCLEIKASPVIPLDNSPLERLQTEHVKGGSIVKGSAVKFNWPKTDSSSKATKIIMQLWAQSIVEDTRFCILSSYDSTTFVYRGDDDRTFYASPAYTTWEAPMLWVVCWMLLAFEKIPGLTAPDVPDTDMTAWDEAVHKNEQPGICTA
ncbi:hypothetical protein EWM64_g211 [Hericium alpestre]|uniref:Uncharacterized protein n=1 Tax=Hericium alpestre TaxID=135208 RepID=A0A4Z0A9P9_9AGAM|nr:hypothetical protein EWM64_g211 [Hericium alpestre]